MVPHTSKILGLVACQSTISELLISVLISDSCTEKMNSRQTVEKNCAETLQPTYS